MPEIHVHMAAGRTNEAKKNLMKAITDAVVTHAGAPIEAVVVQIIEAPLNDKMIGGVVFAERHKK